MNDLVIPDSKGRPVLSVRQSDSGKINIVIHRPVNVAFDGPLGLEVNGEVDFTAHGDIRADAFLSKIFLCSYVAKQIRDLPESIEKRAEFERRNQRHLAWLAANQTKIMGMIEQFIKANSEAEGAA